MEEDDDWFFSVSWTNEAHFPFQGSINFDSCGISTAENPTAVMQISLYKDKVTVCFGYTAPTVIGLFWFEEMRNSGFVTVSVTGEKNADMLQNLSIPSLTDNHLFSSDIFILWGCMALQPHIAICVKDLFRPSFYHKRSELPLLSWLASHIPGSKWWLVLRLSKVTCLPKATNISLHTTSMSHHEYRYTVQCCLQHCPSTTEIIEQWR